MKKGIIISLLLILIVIAALFHFKLPNYHNSNRLIRPVIINDKVSLDEGERLATTICKHCHYNYEFHTLSGRQHGNPEKLGQFFSGNITQDSTYGIGKWTNEDLFYFLKTGIKPNGDYVFDMPKYPNLSDQDMHSLIGFLRSKNPLVSATLYNNPAPEYSFITKAALWVWLRPVDWDTTYVAPVDTSNSIAWGKYLATAKYSCFDCHSRNSVTNNYKYPEKSKGFFKGGNPHVDEEGNEVISPALVPLRADWSQKEFIKTLQTGSRPDGTLLRNPMIPFAIFSDNEARAIYDYLKYLELNEVD